MYQTEARLYLEDGQSVVYCGDATEVLPTLDICPQLIVTSPPYDSLRTYGGHEFSFDRMADVLVSIMPEGGVLVWVVSDATIDGSETGTSFRQALGFMERGLRLHDTMIFDKSSPGPWVADRYDHSWEYMFVFSHGRRPLTANLIADRPSSQAGSRRMSYMGKGRSTNGNHTHTERQRTIRAFGRRRSIWYYSVQGGAEVPLAYKHPAIFPYALAADHIRTLSNPGDLVLDPMAGSGTTLRAAKDLGRLYVGVEIYEPYCRIIADRMAQSVLPIA